jgi:hypothetical protein
MDIKRNRVLSKHWSENLRGSLHPWFSAMAIWTGEAINGVLGNREDSHGILGDSPLQCPFSAKVSMIFFVLLLHLTGAEKRAQTISINR